MQKEKADKIEYERRIKTIQEWLLGGETTKAIHANLISNGWCVSERQMFRMIAAARNRWVADENINIAEKRKMAIERLRKIMERMPDDIKNTSGGFRTLLYYEKEINRIEGIMSDLEPEIENIITIDEML